MGGLLSVDEPQAGTTHSRRLVIRGWALSHDAPIARVVASLDGQHSIVLNHGLARPDVASVHALPFANSSGFAGTIDLSNAPVGTLQLCVSATDTAGSTLHGWVTIEHDPHIDVPEFPDGHFYSPVVDRHEVRRDRARLWPEDPLVLGVDFRAEAQRGLLTTAFPRYLDEFRYPIQLGSNDPPHQYYQRNFSFHPLDARALFVMLRAQAPRAMIEVGSGFSTLLAADVNCRFLDRRMHLTSIDPYPPSFVDTDLPGLSALIKSRAQDVPLNQFENLGEGDILFVDSSHVAKTGSDVNFLLFEVLPRLRSGVFIHIHDIFLPGEYPEKWVLEDGKSWNEQYVVRALLMYSAAFEVVFGSAFVSHAYPDLVQAIAGPENVGGGSLWLRKGTT